MGDGVNEQLCPSPPLIAKAGDHDVNAAKQAERLADAEHVRDQAKSGNGPVIFSGKEAGRAPRSPRSILYSNR
jgi:hypothetical protein